MSATNNTLQAYKAKQRQLNTEMTKSSRKVLWFMLTLGMWFYVADLLKFTLFSHDFMINAASGLLTGALVFWAVDISLMRRIQAYDSEREALLLEYQLILSTENTLHHAARIRELNCALRSLEKRFKINEESSIEILLTYLNLCNMRMDLSNQIDKHIRIQLATMQRAYITFGGKMEIEVIQAMQQNIAEMERTINTNQENMSKVQERIQQTEQRLKFLQKSD